MIKTPTPQPQRNWIAKPRGKRQVSKECLPKLPTESRQFDFLESAPIKQIIRFDYIAFNHFAENIYTKYHIEILFHIYGYKLWIDQLPMRTLNTLISVYCVGCCCWLNCLQFYQNESIYIYTFSMYPHSINKVRPYRQNWSLKNCFANAPCWLCSQPKFFFSFLFILKY